MGSFYERILQRLGHPRMAEQVRELERLKQRRQACKNHISSKGRLSPEARQYVIELAEVTAEIKDLEELLTGKNYHVGEGKE